MTKPKSWSTYIIIGSLVLLAALWTKIALADDDDILLFILLLYLRQTSPYQNQVTPYSLTRRKPAFVITNQRREINSPYMV